MWIVPFWGDLIVLHTYPFIPYPWVINHSPMFKKNTVVLLGPEFSVCRHHSIIFHAHPRQPSAASHEQTSWGEQLLNDLQDGDLLNVTLQVDQKNWMTNEISPKWIKMVWLMKVSEESIHDHFLVWGVFDIVWWMFGVWMDIWTDLWYLWWYFNSIL